MICLGGFQMKNKECPFNKRTPKTINTIRFRGKYIDADIFISRVKNILTATAFAGGLAVIGGIIIF